MKNGNEIIVWHPSPSKNRGCRQRPHRRRPKPVEHPTITDGNIISVFGNQPISGPSHGISETVQFVCVGERSIRVNDFDGEISTLATVAAAGPAATASTTLPTERNVICGEQRKVFK